MTDHQVKARGLGCPPVNPPAQQPFRFDCSRGSFIRDTSWDGGSDSPPSPHWPPRGQDCNRHWRDHRPPLPCFPLPCFPLPSPDCGFKSNRSLLLMASSISSRSNRSEGSQCSQRGRQHWEDRAQMKINLPVFKDEDAKDAVTYQSWMWDLTVYQHVGCRDHTLLSLQFDLCKATLVK